MIVFLCAFLVSVVTTALLIKLFKGKGSQAADGDFSKPQKFHVVPVPRIGGLAIVVGVLVAAAPLAWLDGVGPGTLALTLLACAMPAFLAGFVQDFTEAITPRGRLLATALAAILAFYALDAALLRTGIPGIDWLVGFAAGSLFCTVLTVAGIANAINIIDGFNGLASMCAAIMLAAVAYVAFQVDDPVIGLIALACTGGVLGFFFWNFPGGLIFMGDGGAYFLGFYVAELCILLLVRNPEVSPLFALLVCFYPTFETLFSVYRRRFLRAMPPSMPDGIHLHSLIYRRVLRWTVGSRSARALTRRNSMTSPYLWLLCTLSVLPAVLFWDNDAVLAAFLALFAVSYSVLYWRIVRFKSPRWLSLPARRGSKTQRH